MSYWSGVGIYGISTVDVISWYLLPVTLQMRLDEKLLCVSLELQHGCVWPKP
jgi:hypothetical protein